MLINFASLGAEAELGGLGVPSSQPVEGWAPQQTVVLPTVAFGSPLEFVLNCLPTG